METILAGGCACGSLRYRRAHRPYDAGWCHCRLCQLSSGAPAVAFATVARADFEIEIDAGARWYRSTPFGQRLICARCGSLVAMQVDHQPDTTDFTIATLDDPEIIAPDFHIFRESRIGWFETTDEMPRHERFRPDTRGLAGTDPPGNDKAG